MGAVAMIDNRMVRFRPTRPEDLDYVMGQEDHDENSAYIRHWSREKHLAAINDPNFAHFIVERIDDARPVGFVILIGVQEPDGNLEFKRIAISEKGNGYGREAVRLIKQFAFEKTNTYRLWLEVVENNDRAFRLYESEGFITEGTHRESAVLRGKRTSLIVMSMLRREYR
jgi:diamine N-acetyltransferase